MTWLYLQAITCATNSCQLLRQDIATVYDGITARLVARRIASKVQEQPLDLLDITLSPLRRHAGSFVDDVRASAHLSVEEAWGDDVDSCEVAPLARQTLAQMRDGCFRGVVDL